ncbi:MAG: sulfatase-like hydrolase/transferase, partial [Clostridiales bacterium]|nr:sulfatase-like hydrolase/transferase [Clostridiales bacterium]
YLACNMELDLALAYLLDQLEAAGELENTVICMSGDHYPYAMDPATWNEFAGHEVDTTFEVYESTLILWAGDMEEPVVVDKPCESLDIIATLSNLFGLEYDSRLIAGRDILADEPGLVVFSNRSFITDLGRYDAASDTFTPNEGAEVPEGYVTRIFQEV